MDSPFIFILSWQRPLYLWACLDGLRMATKEACRIVLIDNASTDPFVARVIDSFEARDFFYQVYRRNTNSPFALEEAVREHQAEVGEYFMLIESDVVVLPSQPTWLEEFRCLCAADPKLAMLGSLVDKSDFIDPVWAKRRFPHFSEEQLQFLTKSKSKERALADHYDERVIDPFNPPGRLLCFKTEAFLQIGDLPDTRLYLAMKELGYHCGIATRVRHRHLSLANAFDYPEYDKAERDAYFRRQLHERKKK